jgi:hypothetical protein
MTLTVVALITMLTWTACGAGPVFGLDAHAVSAATTTLPAQAAPPDAKFTTVDGATLSARLADATARGRREGSASHFWVAYQFDVRPGVRVDSGPENRKGRRVTFDGVNIELGSTAEARNVGIFMLYERKTPRPDRVELFDLDSDRDYGNRPVYWLGRATADESFALLEGLLDDSPSTWVAERAVVAISLHSDARAADRVETVVRDLRRPEQLRRHAVIMLGTMPGDGIVSRLRSIYESTEDEEIREHALTAAGIHAEDKENAPATDFLIHVAETERNRELRRHAIFWLGQMAGSRSFGALERAVNEAEDDVQQHVVFAISQRSKDEAVPALINIARTHKSLDVRKRAIFWLGQIDDERVVPFLKEILGK